MRRLSLTIIFLLFLPVLCHAAVLSLSLSDAILLAVRENPNVQTAQLNYILQKYALEIQQWQFQPHYNLQATQTTARNYSVTAGGAVTTNVTGIEPAATLLTPFGTQLTLTANNNITNHYNPGVSLQIMQPLLRGFGRPIVEAALYNAMDSEKISRLNITAALRNTATSVINAYIDVVLAEHLLVIDQQALIRAQASVKQTELFIKAGHKAGMERVAVQADVANAEAQIENDKNNLNQRRYELLMAIGLDPNTRIKLHQVDLKQLIRKYSLPTLTDAKQQMLEHDIQYQIDQITLHGTIERSVVAAEDNTRWQLNLTLNSATGYGNGGGANAGVNSLVNGVNQTNMAMLNLTIPLDDRTAKLALVSAKIARQQAQRALQQEKWSKETGIINSWHNIDSAARSVHFAENAQRLQQKTYQISLQKYTYGLIDSLELQTAQQHYRAAEQALLNAKINYLKFLVNLDLLTGNTLKTWDIKTRYAAWDVT